MRRLKNIVVMVFAAIVVAAAVWITQTPSAHAIVYTTADLNHVPWSLAFPNLFQPYNGRCSDSTDPNNPIYYGVGQWSTLTTQNGNDFSHTSLSASPGDTVNLYIVYANIYCQGGIAVDGTWNYLTNPTVDGGASLGGVPTTPIWTYYTNSYDGSTFAITAVPITVTIPANAPAGNNVYSVSYNAQRINHFNNGTPNTCVGHAPNLQKPNPPYDPLNGASYAGCDVAFANLSIKVNVTPKPTGNVTATCDPTPTVSGSAVDTADRNSQINVDLYYDHPADSSLVGTIAYQRVQTSGNGHTYSASIPANYVDDNPHTVYAYGIGSMGNTLLSGSPAAFKCPVPAAQYHPWLQTKNGDVTANNSITGQTFFQPGARNNFVYGEAQTYTAPGTSTGQANFTSQGSVATVNDGGSMNAAGQKKSLALYGNDSGAVIDNYTGPLSGVSAYIRGEVYNGPPKYTLKVINKDTGATVASDKGTVDGSYKFVSANQYFANGSDPKVGNYKVVLTFDNDLYGGNPAADRNLFVDQIRIYSNAISGPEATYVRVSPQLLGDANNPSDNFCSLNYYYLSAIDNSGEFSCNPAGVLNYDIGSASLMSDFSKMTTAINSAYNSSLTGSCSPYVVSNSLTATSCSNGEIIKYNSPVTLNATSIPKGRHTIWVKGSVTINGNITPSLVSGLPPEQQPTLGIIADGGDVTVTSGVSQINALVYTTGKFNTCAGYNTVLSSACRNPLVLNGQVISQGGFTFGRNYFSRYQPNQSPAEQFVLNPMAVSYAPPGFDRLFWSLDQQLNFTSSELQPRLR